MPSKSDTTGKKNKTSKKNRVEKSAVSLKRSINKNSIVEEIKEKSVNDVGLVSNEQTKFGTRKMLILGLITIFALLAFSYRYLLVPASVNGKPIFIWTYLSQLHKQYGKQVVNQLIDIELINQQAEKSGIIVQTDEIENEYNKLSAQVAESGGIETFLASQGLTMSEAKKQISLNLKLQRLLEGQATVSAEEIQTEYENNKDYFAEVSEEDAKKQIEDGLVKQKLQSLISPWFDEQRSSANINILMPGISGL
jgi:hypothetical protein